MVVVTSVEPNPQKIVEDWRELLYVRRDGGTPSRRAHHQRCAPRRLGGSMAAARRSGAPASCTTSSHLRTNGSSVSSSVRCLSYSPNEDHDRDRAVGGDRVREQGRLISRKLRRAEGGWRASLAELVLMIVSLPVPWPLEYSDIKRSKPAAPPEVADRYLLHGDTW